MQRAKVDDERVGALGVGLGFGEGGERGSDGGHGVGLHDTLRIGEMLIEHTTATGRH